MTKLHDYFLELTKARVAPADRPWEAGVVVAGGKTRPFLVERAWSGPAGHYVEQWSIRRNGETIYRGPARPVRIRGMQTRSGHVDTVDEPIALEPGIYRLVFVVEGYRMGEVDFDVMTPEQAAEAVAAAAAAAGAAAPEEPAAPPRTAAPAARRAAARPAAGPGPPTATPAGEDPAEARRRVYDEELEKGSDPRVAEARAKAAEVRARKAMEAAASGAAPAAATPAAPAKLPEKKSAGESKVKAERAAPARPGMTEAEAAKVRELVHQEAVAEGKAPEVAEALARAAEVRARRGPWWRPDW